MNDLLVWMFLLIVVFGVCLPISITLLDRWKKRDAARRILEGQIREWQPAPDPLVEVEPWSAPSPEAEAEKLQGMLLDAGVRQHAELVRIDPQENRAAIRMYIDNEWVEWLGIPDRGLFRLLVEKLLVRAGIAPETGEGQGAFRLLNKVEKPVFFWGDLAAYQYTVLERPRENRIVEVTVRFGRTAEGPMLELALQRQSPTARRGLFDLGMEPEAEHAYLDALLAGKGVILFNAPCGSGKSTATYAGLKFLVGEGMRVSTLEWPVHHRLEGASQHEFDPHQAQGAKGWGAVEAEAERMLRGVIAERPDVLLVQSLDSFYTFGDRFQELALDFADAGGLLVSAMHFRSPNSPFWYWRQTAVKGYAHTPEGCVKERVLPNPQFRFNRLLTLLVSTRLLPMVCAHCAEEYTIPAQALRRLGLDIAPEGRVPLFRGRGCPRCRNSGSSGHVGVFEAMPATAAVRAELPLKVNPEYGHYEHLQSDAEAPKAAAWREGMLTLREAALMKALRGDITVETAASETPLYNFRNRERCGRLVVGENRVYKLPA